MADKINSGNVEGLFEFLSYLTDKGYAPPTAIEPWRTASRRIVSTMEGEKFGALDVTSLDVDEYMDRFDNLVRGDVKHESLVSYRQRFRKAIDAYRSFLKDGKPPAFRASSKRGAGDKPKGNGTTARPKATTSIPANEGGLMEFPFPLDDGRVAHLHLPPRLDEDDAERLATFVRTLQRKPQRRLPEKAAA